MKSGTDEEMKYQETSCLALKPSSKITFLQNSIENTAFSLFLSLFEIAHHKFE